MYSVHVTLRIWNRPQPTVEGWRSRLPSDAPEAPRFAELHYELELPFSPGPGIVLEEDTWRSGPLSEVTWQAGEERFVCSVAEQFGADRNDYQRRLNAALEFGWRRTGGDAPGWLRGLVADV